MPTRPPAPGTPLPLPADPAAPPPRVSIATCQRPDILIVDEVGYAQLDRESAELMFQLVCSRYEKGSIILTSNKYFSDWGELMSDTVIATAMLDRLLHHAHVINIRGETYRLKDRLKAGLKTVPPADISTMDKPATP